MRIAIFTNNYLPNPYGVPTSIETFRREFEKRGHTVFIFAPQFPGYVDKNPNVFRYPSVDTNIKFHFPLGIPVSKRVDRIIRKLDFDIIHSQHPNLLGAAAKKWARKKKIPLVFTWHTLYDRYANFVPFIPKKIVTRYIIRRAVNFANKADTVVVPTDSIIPVLKEWRVENKNIVPVITGVVEEDFQNPDNSEIRKKYNISQDEIVLILASRLTEEKNIIFLFNSLKEILKNRGKVKLLIVGGGYLKEEIEEKAKREGIDKKIFFSGELPHDKIKDYFAAADIFVYGSKSETQGMFPTEAMYMGLPVVAVSATGINSLVLNNGNGFLVEENEKEFASAVTKLIEDEDLRQKFGETSEKIAWSQFTASVSAEKMLKVYEEAIRNYSK